MLLHVVIMNLFLLLSVNPSYGYTINYLSILLLIDFWVVCKFVCFFQTSLWASLISFGYVTGIHIFCFKKLAIFQNDCTNLYCH